MKAKRLAKQFDDSDLEEANKSDILGPDAIMRGWVKFLTFYPSEELTYIYIDLDRKIMI